MAIGRRLFSEVQPEIHFIVLVICR